MERGAGRAGFVLVGGRSSRMGRDKALLPYGGATLVEHVAAAVEAAAGSVTLVGHPERYRELPYPAIPDLSPEVGPLGGLEAALSHSQAEWNLVVACDMPGVTARLLTSLLEVAEHCGGRCLVPVSQGGRLEPLCAVYHRDCLDRVRRSIRDRVWKMQEVVAALDPTPWPAGDSRPFENWNTPQDRGAHR